MRTWSGILISLSVCMIAGSILLPGCAGRQSASEIGGTWVKSDFQGNRFVLNLDPAARSYAVDYTADGRWDVQGECIFDKGKVTFVDTSGEQRCPGIKGVYTYFLDDDLGENMMHLWMVQDSCSGRAWVMPGDWLIQEYQPLIDHLNQAIAADSTDREALYHRGRIRLALWEYEKAYEDLDRAIGLGLERAGAYAGRGFARVWASRDYKGGLADYDRAIELDPDDARAYAWRGRIKFELNEKYAACKDWETAFEKGYLAAEKLMLAHCRYLLKDRYLKGTYPKRRSSQETQPE
jgi:hypothetical protein